MMDFAIHLEARDPARNIWRAYSITAGQDLFGDWIVAMNYGRIGSRGTTKTVLLSDEEAVRRYVRQCLKKRESAPKRIGIDYKVIQIDGRWEEFIEPKHPS
jgi:predicted DNA-binding WGR domain protein